jgi:nucleoid DNA-binding protein
MAIWFNYKELEPHEPNPPSRLKPKVKIKGRPKKPEQPHIKADAEKKPYFSRTDLIRRVAQITGIRMPTCRLFVNAALAAILSEVELGHDVDIPGVGRFMFEDVEPIRYKHKGLWYIRPLHKRLVFSVYPGMEIALKRNTRIVDWSDSCDPRLNKIFTYWDAKS